MECGVVAFTQTRSGPLPLPDRNEWGGGGKEGRKEGNHTTEHDPGAGWPAMIVRCHGVPRNSQHVAVFDVRPCCCDLPHYTVFTPANFITQGAEQSTSKAEGVPRTTRNAACV